MTSAVPTAAGSGPVQGPPLNMCGPDFPFAYDRYLAHPAGIGQVPAERSGTEVAVVGGGLSGIVTAYELMKMGLRPVVYEADRIGGRLRTEHFPGVGSPEVVAEMGAMRFPLSSTAFWHYADRVGLRTAPFPNPLAPATPSTVVDLKGESHYATTPDDLPEVYREVARAWERTLEEGAQHSRMQRAIRERDAKTQKEIWNGLVEKLDDRTFYGFLCDSPAFASFRHREIFGQVGFGTGGWDTDFPNSILEILRVTYTGADDDHRSIVGGVQQLPLRLWEDAPDKIVHWAQGTALADLHAQGPHPAVTALHRTAGGGIAVTDASGATRTYAAAVFTAQSWMMLSKVDCDESLLPIDHWTAIERTHYMESSKLFVPVDRAFWKDKDPETGHDVMSMTLTDRMTRGTYLLEGPDPDGPAAICMSYTWCDDSLKWLTLSPDERLEVMLSSLAKIYPGVDIRSHITGDPVTVSWEDEPYFMGAFKANLPGHYRYQRRLFTHFVQDGLPPKHRGLFLAGDDVSWTAGWAEGAVQTALNAVWGVMRHLGGATDPTNPGPGDEFEELAPVALPEG